MAARRAQPPSPSDAAYARVRAICLGFPAAEEKLSHGAPSFHVRGKMFLTFVDNHHGDGRLAVWCKSSHEAQRSLVASDPAKFLMPGQADLRWNWAVVRLSAIDPEEMHELVLDAWRLVVPKSVAAAYLGRP